MLGNGIILNNKHESENECFKNKQTIKMNKNTQSGYYFLQYIYSSVIVDRPTADVFGEHLVYSVCHT